MDAVLTFQVLYNYIHLKIMDFLLNQNYNIYYVCSKLFDMNGNFKIDFTKLL